MAEYLPLEGPGSIRLLRLIDKPLFSPFRATLKVVKLSDNPAYTALSHTWGEATESERIDIDGHILYIRKNLGRFLKVVLGYMRKEHPSDELWVWVDALCIRQDDIGEKNDQVSQIDKVFETAIRVFGWLGNDRSIANSLTSLNTNRTRKQNVLGPIADSPYWTRTWIVQECGLAQNLLFFSRKIHCRSELIRYVWTKRRGDVEEYSFMQRILLLHRSNTPVYIGPRGQTLLEAIRLFHDTKCQVPHDKVFALQSIADPLCRCRVDYDVEAGILFWQVLIANSTTCGVDDAENLVRALRISWDDVRQAIQTAPSERLSAQPLRMSMPHPDWYPETMELRDQRLGSYRLLCGNVKPGDISRQSNALGAISFLLRHTDDGKQSFCPSAIIVRVEITDLDQGMLLTQESCLQDIKVADTDVRDPLTPSSHVEVTLAVFHAICSIERQYTRIRNENRILTDGNKAGELLTMDLGPQLAPYRIKESDLPLEKWNSRCDTTC